MKITDVKVSLCEAAFDRKRLGQRSWVFVQVETDEGITGIGEATNWPGDIVVASAVKQLAPMVVGEDPFNVERVWQRLYDASSPYGLGGVVVSGISGIDIALWDIMGKKLKEPVCRLLGGRYHERIKLYANSWFWTYKEGGAEFKPEAYAKMAERHVLGEGYEALKFDPFRTSWRNREGRSADARHAEAMVKAVRETVGEDVDVCVEAHGRFDADTAILMGKRLERYNPLFYEEPVPPENADAMAKVSAHLDIPIATGERLYTSFGFREVLEKNAVDIVQPDIARTGGITELKKIAALAHVHYVHVSPHNPNGPVATMASVHACASTPNFIILEYVANDVPWREQVATPIEAKNGYIQVPTKPGLGIELDEKEIAKHPYKGP